MNKKDYDYLTLEYGFLDDYEKEYNVNLKNNINKGNVEPNSSNISNDSPNKFYLNNYPTLNVINPEKEKLKNLENNRKEYNKTPYGAFVSRDLDLNKLDDEEYVYKNLQIIKANSTTEMLELSDQQVLNDAIETIKKLEYKYYAILNKEFNILNMKMVKCSIMCYDNPNLFTVNEAKLCAEKCHANIKEAQKFTEKINENYKNKLITCLEDAREFNMKNGEDKILLFFKCYEELSQNFIKMEKEIKLEFSNFI